MLKERNEAYFTIAAPLVSPMKVLYWSTTRSSLKGENDKNKINISRFHEQKNFIYFEIYSLDFNLNQKHF